MSSEQKRVSYELIKLGLRPPEVHALTGYMIRKLRTLYEEIHGRTPPQGQVPQHVDKRIRTVVEYYESITFYHIFTNLYNKVIQIANPKELIEAYKAYRFITNSPLPFSTIYLLVRDIKTGWIKPKKCSTCKNLYLYNYTHSLMYCCPFCRWRNKKTYRKKRG